VCFWFVIGLAIDVLLNNNSEKLHRAMRLVHHAVLLRYVCSSDERHWAIEAVPATLYKPFQDYEEFQAFETSKGH